MVDKFKKILEEMKKQGTVTLFAILKMDDLTDKWSVLISAPWISDANRKQVFADIVGLIKKEMLPEEAANIARVLIVPEGNHLVSELLEQKRDYIGGEGSVKINGNMVHEAYILEPQWDATRTAAAATAN